MSVGLTSRRIVLTAVLAAAFPGTAQADFFNGGPVSIPDGQASPYPAEIAVTGYAEVVTQVKPRLTHLSHTYTGDLDVLLAGPGGQRVLLLSDVGSGAATTDTLTFSDLAAEPAPDDFTSGTYRPRDVDDGIPDVFPGVASGPFGTSLTAFNGVDANGVWKLYVVDDEAGETGALSSWLLDIDGRRASISRMFPDAATRAEAGGAIKVAIHRDPPSGGSPHYGARLDYQATGVGGATPGSDFAPVSGSLEFGPGETSKTFEVPLMDDRIPESTNEGIRLSWGASGDIRPPDGSFVNIVDNDPGARRPALGGRKSQRVLRQGGAVVSAVPNAYGRLKATGTIAVPKGAARAVRLKGASVVARAGRKASLKLKLTRSAKRALQRAFRRKRKLTATVKVTLTDLAGKKATASRKIALRR